MSKGPPRFKSTSFSRASDYERCPLFAKFRHIDKIPDPAPDLPEGKEHPKDRGIRIHELAENYVNNPLLRMPEELLNHEARFKEARELKQRGAAHTEIGLGFDKDWRQAATDDFDNCVYRLYADLVIHPNADSIMIVDYKTGKKEGNEIAHHQQLMEYAVGFATAFPHLEMFYPQIWYLDLHPGENVMKKTFTRDQVMRASKRVRERHQTVLDARIFPATPSQRACYFCPYKAGTVGRGARAYPGTGHCRRNLN